MNWLRNKMYGRYGSDQLNMALIIIAVVFSFVSLFVAIPFFSFIGFVPLGLSLYRMLSKDIAKRQQENYKFTVFLYKIKGFFTGIGKRAKDSKDFRFYACPSCKQKLRVPRGKGKIKLTCPKCKTQFVKNT